MRIAEIIMSLGRQIISVLRLFLLVVLYSVEQLLPRFQLLNRVFNALSREKEKSYDIRTRNLISLAFRQILYKRSRAYITIGAVAIAMGTIMLLVSIGYGVQRAIIKRVATDVELVHVDVIPQAGQKTALTLETIRSLDRIDHVEKVQPIIGVVGKVEREGSEFDVVAYGVTKEYLENSETLTLGEYFEYNEIPMEIVEYVEEESGAGEQVEEDDQEEAAGGGVQGGVDVQSESGSEGRDEAAAQGETVDSESNIQGESSSLEWIDLEKDDSEKGTAKIIELNSEVEKYAVINTKLASVLNVDPSEAKGIKVDVTYVAIEDLLGMTDQQAQSETVEYEVVAVVEDESQSLLYVPLDNIWSMGATKFSQARVTVDDQNEVVSVRDELESRGFLTKSVFDTIEEIESFFSIARIALGAVGMGALLVASLGMFNTLTVSLLERSREVGLLKVLGMKSQQVYNLFITESLIMGLWGGIFGILIAFVGGKLLSLLFSMVTLSRGGEIVDISYIPLTFLVMSFGIMVLLSFFTGVYPARRATKISALDALRYE